MLKKREQDLIKELGNESSRLSTMDNTYRQVTTSDISTIKNKNEQLDNQSDRMQSFEEETRKLYANMNQEEKEKLIKQIKSLETQVNCFFLTKYFS